MRLEEIVKERILILDGAMGTMIQRYGLTEADFRGERFRDVPGLMAGNNDLLSLTRPDVIRDIHRKYLAAGADIIETNTFSSQRVSMADYHVEDYCREINLAASRKAAFRGRFGGTDQQNLFDESRCEQSGIPRPNF